MTNGNGAAHAHNGRTGRAARNGAARAESCRIATYSPGMVGFGHIRRNASIAQALQSSALRPAIMMIAEAWQAGTLPMPPGTDCVTLPALRKEGDGLLTPRFVGISEKDLLSLRSRVIRGALESFDPDVLIVDHLPLGAARELEGTLERLRRRGRTWCVLGLRDVLQDRESTLRLWADRGYAEAIRSFYDAIWVYSDPAVYDLVGETGVFDDVADRVTYTGYLDQRPRLEYARARTEALLGSLPEGRLALCTVGGGYDGNAIVEAFVEAELPADMHGMVVTGPYMPDDERRRLTERLRGRPRMQWIDFLPETVALVERADRIIGMGGYNTVCEVLSFDKHALIVPRVEPNTEQWIRAERMREMGLLHVLHPDELSPGTIGAWLARDLGPPPDCRSRLDLGGLGRIPALLASLLDTGHEPVRRAVPFSTPAWVTP